MGIVVRGIAWSLFTWIAVFSYASFGASNTFLGVVAFWGIILFIVARLTMLLFRTLAARRY